MSLLRIDSSQSCRSACSSLALAYCLIARAWRRSSARWSIFAPASRRPASMTPTTCSSWSSAASIPFTPRRASAWRSSAFDRQVPMIEQCSVSASSQILLRLAGCGDATSEGARNSTSVGRSSLISGGSAVAARRLFGMGGSNDTNGSLYLFEYSEYGPGAALLERGKFAASRGSGSLICSVVYSGGAARTSGPIPKLVRIRGTFRCELRNQRTTSNLMILVLFSI